jgi:ubiquilin
MQMGPPPNPDQLLQMMDDPNFLQQMNEAMNNPAVIDMMQQNPMVRNNPMIQEMLRNPEMRRMMFNPEMMRMQLQMQRAMGGNTGAGGGSSFPMPGATNTTPQDANTQNQPSTGAAAQDPFGGMFGAGGAGGAGANPFASLFGPGGIPGATPSVNQNPSSTSGTDASASATGADGSQNPPAAGAAGNPFASLFGAPPTAGADPQQANPIAEAARNLMSNPDAMQAAMRMMGQMNGSTPGANPLAGLGGAQPGTTNPGAANPFAALMGAGGFGGGGGFGAPPPQDNRPPEEVYESQLRQLNEMGFYEFERNVAALRRSGGNVQGAIDFLLGGGS